MRLGNSNKQNTGKKYIIRGKNDTHYKESDLKKANSFNEWFGNNYHILRSKIQKHTILNEDAFNATYIRVYEAILYSGLIVNNGYEGYFFRAYFTNKMQSNINQSRYCELFPDYDIEEINYGYYLEIEDKQKQLETDIFNYIYKNYDIRDFELFKMYMSLKPAVNYSALAEITRLKEHTIQRAISKIKKDILSNNEFIKRRKELL